MNGEGGLIKKTPVQESGFWDSAEPAAGDGPVGTYKALSRVKPNGSQREMIAKQVDDSDLWRKTIEHWMGHGWNSRNVAGMLKLYQQGGPEVCLFCQDPPEREPTQEEIFRELLDE